MPANVPASGSGEASDPDKTICFCHCVSRNELIKAIRSGSTTLNAIKADTFASTGCGGCELEVVEILEAELALPK
jgi:nitrite reductase (NADH) large subunit